MRNASEVSIGFPYKAKSVCFIEQDLNGNLQQLNYVQEKRNAYYNVKEGKSKLYAVWPGQYTSDLFEIDDIEAYGKAFIKELNNI